MSDVLARLRVTETHGIRRFLYPLTAEVVLPPHLGYGDAGIATPNTDIDRERLRLITTTGQEIPVQVTQRRGEQFQVDFAVSLAPGEVCEYLLTPGTPKIVDDPLHLSLNEEETCVFSQQQRFEIALGRDSLMDSVTYDGQSLLRDRLSITRNSASCQTLECSHSPLHLTLAARTVSLGIYGYASLSQTTTSLTACKSWAAITHQLSASKPFDELLFTLPLAVTSPTLTYDLGLEGVYGKIGPQERMTWQLWAKGKSGARWELKTNDRLDYAGVMTGAEFERKRWLHLVDSDKALAVALTCVPRHWKAITITLDSSGDVQIAFQMPQRHVRSAAFGVCYHFLNDVPAIAAATNPPSILLPPTVEVLPI